MIKNRLAEKKRRDYNMRMQIRVVIEKDEETNSYAAYCPELPGCASAGETESEALANIREAIGLFLAPTELDTSGKIFQIAV